MYRLTIKAEAQRAQQAAIIGKMPGIKSDRVLKLLQKAAESA